MSLGSLGGGELSRAEEERRRLAASRIPFGYIHPKKAFTAGYLLLVLAWASVMSASLYSTSTGVLAGVLAVSSWIVFYVGWQYDFLLFQQLPNLDRPSKWMGVAIAFTGPVAAGIYWLSRPRGY